MVGSNLPIRRIRFLGRTGILSRFQYMVHEMSVFFFRDFQFSEDFFLFYRMRRRFFFFFHADKFVIFCQAIGKILKEIRV